MKREGEEITATCLLPLLSTSWPKNTWLQKPGTKSLPHVEERKQALKAALLNPGTKKLSRLEAGFVQTLFRKLPHVRHQAAARVNLANSNAPRSGLVSRSNTEDRRE